eukprot:Skav222800  [mRNA]  locus=scaffold1419:378703:379175:+ [translate_table: standard]
MFHAERQHRPERKGSNAGLPPTNSLQLPPTHSQGSAGLPPTQSQGSKGLFPPTHSLKSVKSVKSVLERAGKTKPIPQEEEDAGLHRVLRRAGER